MRTVIINRQSLKVKEYGGQRVVTFADIDAVHCRPEGTARRNFNNNRQHFLIGVDYFVRNSYEAAEYGIVAPNGLILMTESGYLMLVKSFTDDLAWKVQRELVNSYFKAEKPAYEYFDKTYKGEPIITATDFSYFTGVGRDSVVYYIKNNCLKSGKDYYLINNDELRKFKLENPQCSKLINSLYLITKSGFTKLLKCFCMKLKLPECFALSETKRNSLISHTPSVASFLHGTKKVVDVPENIRIQREIESIKRDCYAMLSMVELANKYYSDEDYGKITVSIHHLGVNLSCSASKLKEIKPNIIEKIV